MSAPNTIRMEVLLEALAALEISDRFLRDSPGQTKLWIPVMEARVALQSALGRLQPVQVEGGSA